MATLKIQIKDSKFVSHNGVNVEEFTERYIKGNDWECRISEEGRIDCIATQFYKDERHQIKFKINKGYVKLLLKIGDEYPRVLKRFILEKWPQDGEISLPNGYIDLRRPFFRNANFQNFLKEYGLTAVHCESPNKTFKVRLNRKEDEVVFYEEIITDGKIEEISKNQLEENGLKINTLLKVINANWAIKAVWKSGKCMHRILYTQDDPKQIAGLPKLG